MSNLKNNLQSKEDAVAEERIKLNNAKGKLEENTRKLNDTVKKKVEEGTKKERDKLNQKIGELAQEKEDWEEICQHTLVIPLTSRGRVIFVLVLLGLIGYFCYWGVRLHIADFKSETEYCKQLPYPYEKRYAEKDGYLHYRASYIKALINAQFIEPEEIKSWKVIPAEHKELSNAVRAVAWDMQNKYYNKLRPIERPELTGSESMEKDEYHGIRRPLESPK